MGRSAPVAAKAPAPQMTLEIVTTAGIWFPPEGVTEVHVELNGGGGGGRGGAVSSGTAGQAGDIVNFIERAVTSATPFSVVIGNGGADQQQGGSTTVSVKGIVREAVGGNNASNRRGASGGVTGNSFTIRMADPSAVSLLLRQTNFSASAPPANPNSSNSYAMNGGSSPLGKGGHYLHNGSPISAGLGAGGIPGGSGGPGYVIFGYFL